jgi:tetratricopeptide (TPR) repeat protein
MVRPHRLVRPFFALFLLGCIAAASRAADKWAVAVGPSHEPDPFHYDAKLWKDVPKDYLDDAAACTLYAGTNYLVEPDGTIETVVHDVTRLNGRKGVEKLGEYRNISFDPAYEALTLNTAVVHKADGRDAPIEPRDVQLRDVSTDYQVYDHEKQFIISFPNLEVGDVFEVKWTVRGKNPEHAGQFFTRYTFGDVTYPCVADELRVRLPKAMPFKYASFAGKIDPVRTEDKEQVQYLWKSVHIRQLPQDENLPSKEDLRLGVACSTFPSWEAVGQWKQKLRKDCWVCSAEVRQTARDATKNIDDPIAKARALVYWLRRNIRYVAAGETHDFTPHLPSEILANRYGDCKDTTQLLAVMMREVGIKVELATLGALDDGQVLESLPSPSGTHAILLTTIDGKEHWTDTTSSLAGWDFLPHDDHDRVCYVVNDKGDIRLTRTPPLTADDNRFEQTTNVWVGADGSTRCERDVTSFGSASLTERDEFLEVPVGERRRQVVAELQDANSKARLIQLKIDEDSLRDFDRPVTTHVVFSIADHFTGETDKEGSIADSKVWGKLLAYNLDYDRQIALQFYAPFESHHHYIVHVPPIFTLDGTPSDQTVHSPWGEFTRTAKVLEDGRSVSVDFITRLNKSRIDPADFDKFRSFHDSINRYYRVWLTLKPTQDLADAPVLEALLAKTPDDAPSAAALARIYVQNNKEADARKVLGRALHFHSDDQALLELSVKAAETAQEQTAAQRELVRLFPAEERYTVELGSLLIDQDLNDKAREVLEPLARQGTALHRALAHYQLARSCYRKNDMQAALKHLEEAEKAEPETVNTARTNLLKGLILEDLQRPEEAAVAYRMALTLNNQAEEALEALIRLSLAADKPDEALPYLRRYITVVGDDFNGLLQGAEFSLRMQRWDDAFELAGRARDQRFHEKAQRILGLVYLHRGEFAQAAKHLDKADPDDEVLNGLIRAHLALGMLREAAYQGEKAGKLDKRSPELASACEHVLRLLKRREELAKQQAAPAGKEADWADALDRVVCAEDALDDGAAPDAATGLLEPIFAKNLEMGAAFALRGRIALGRGRLTAALADAERAVKLTPTAAGGYYVRGLVRQERTDLPGALADLEKAGKLTESRNADVLHAWATVLHSSGRLAEALDAQHKAVKLRPKNKEMADQLKALESEAGHAGGAK